MAIGDVIKMVVHECNICFWINESYIGVAFTDPRLSKDNLYPILYLGCQGDSVKLMPGG